MEYQNYPAKKANGNTELTKVDDQNANLKMNNYDINTDAHGWEDMGNFTVPQIESAQNQIEAQLTALDNNYASEKERLGKYHDGVTLFLKDVQKVLKEKEAAKAKKKK
jgi:hypothetical protein